jgi:hypothetical protein
MVYFVRSSGVSVAPSLPWNLTSCHDVPASADAFVAADACVAPAGLPGAGRPAFAIPPTIVARATDRDGAYAATHSGRHTRNPPNLAFLTPKADPSDDALSTRNPAEHADDVIDD